MKVVHLKSKVKLSNSGKVCFHKDPEYLAQLKMTFIKNHNKSIKSKADRLKATGSE